MKSALHGSGISEVEVTNISGHGFWVLASGEEFFLPFDLYPWFADAPVRQILHVLRPSPQHLHWPDLDVDLELDCLRSPGDYPLVAQV